MVISTDKGIFMADHIDLNRYFLRNTLSISTGEFLWGLGLPVILESTFIPVFLTTMGVSNSRIGVTGMIFSISIAVVPSFSAYMTARMPYKKRSTVWLQVIPSAAVMFLGLYYMYFGINESAYAVFIFFYSLFAVGLSATIPVWQNFIVKIFSPQNSLRGISFMMIANNSAKLMSGMILAFITGAVGMNLSYSGAFFFFTGAVFLTGSLVYFFTRENKDEIDKKALGNFINYFIHNIIHILKNRNMILFLLQDIEFTAAAVSVTFYARYAIDCCRVPASKASGAFIVSLFIGAVCASFALGFVRKITVKARYLFIKICTLSGIMILVLFQSLFAFYTVSFLLGFSRSGRLQMYGPAVKGISGHEDASAYYAISPLLTMPCTALLPVAMGLMLDRLSFLKAESYRIGFLSVGVIVIISFVPFFLLSFQKRT